VAFLPFQFVCSSLTSTTDRNDVNFEFLNSLFQPVHIVFKCVGGLRLKIFPPILITLYIDNGKNTVKTGCLLGDWADELGKDVWIADWYQQVQRVIVIRLTQVKLFVK
jgi:hypothetical protein